MKPTGTLAAMAALAASSAPGAAAPAAPCSKAAIASAGRAASPWTLEQAEQRATWNCTVRDTLRREVD